MNDQFHKLTSKWKITEQYNINPGQPYENSIREVCTIDSVEELGFLMNKTIYGKLTEMFCENYK